MFLPCLKEEFLRKCFSIDVLNFKVVLFHVSWVCCFSIFVNSICPAGLTLLICSQAAFLVWTYFFHAGQDEPEVTLLKKNDSSKSLN